MKKTRHQDIEKLLKQFREGEGQLVVAIKPDTFKKLLTCVQAYLLTKCQNDIDALSDEEYTMLRQSSHMWHAAWYSETVKITFGHENN